MTTPRQGPRRSGVAAYAPLVVAVCVMIVVRGAMEGLFSGLSSWVVFGVALIVGLLAYAGVERWFARRN